MGYFHAKNANWAQFWGVLRSEMLVNFMDIGSVLLPFGIFSAHMVYVFCGHLGVYVFSRFDLLWREKFCNPVLEHKTV
jgi:hypothetical protein